MYLSWVYYGKDILYWPIKHFFFEELKRSRVKTIQKLYNVECGTIPLLMYCFLKVLIKTIRIGLTELEELSHFKVYGICDKA